MLLGSDDMTETRNPIQKRSIEKKNRIISKGFELMCNNGYHKTSTADIAKYAGVSTGIVYQYFNDKKEIFDEGVRMYSNEIMFPIFLLIDEHKKLPSDLRKFFKDIIHTNKKMHTTGERAHQEISSMQHLDKDVERIFLNSEFTFSNKLYNLFVNNGYDKSDLKERVHLIVNLIDNLAHEEVYHNHEELDYDNMEDIVVDIILDILKK